MDMDAIDLALHEIQQMVEVVIRAAENLVGAGLGRETSEMPAADAQLLDFSVFDVAKRVKALRADLYPQESAKAPVLTLVRSSPDLSALTGSQD